MGGLHPFSRVIGFYRGAHRNRAAFLRIGQPEQIALDATFTDIIFIDGFWIRSAVVDANLPIFLHIGIVVHVFQNDIHAAIKAQQLDLRGRQGFGKGEYRTAGGCFAVFRVAGRDLYNVLFARPIFGGFKGVLVGVDRGGGQNFGHFLISFTVLHLDRHLIVRCARYSFPCNTVAPVDGGSVAGSIAQNSVDVGNRGSFHTELLVQHVFIIGLYCRVGYVAHIRAVAVVFFVRVRCAAFAKGKQNICQLFACFSVAYNGIVLNIAVAAVNFFQRISAARTHVGNQRRKILTAGCILSRVKAIAGDDFGVKIRFVAAVLAGFGCVIILATRVRLPLLQGFQRIGCSVSVCVGCR